MSIFKQSKSLSELEEEDEQLDTELSIARKKAMIRELNRRGVDWRRFSDNGKRSGLNFTRIWQWLKTH